MLGASKNPHWPQMGFGEENPGWLFDIGELYYPIYMGIIIIRGFPYQPISRMKCCHKGSERCLDVVGEGKTRGIWDYRLMKDMT